MAEAKRPAKRGSAKRRSAEAEGTLDLAAALGAKGESSEQMLAIFIPEKDKDGHAILTQDKWVDEFAELLCVIGGGVTVMPPARGGWLNEERGTIVWERPVLVYSYVKADRFLAQLPRLRALLHRLGRETNQGEIAVQFGGVFVRLEAPFEED